MLSPIFIYATDIAIIYYAGFHFALLRRQPYYFRHYDAIRH